MENNWIPWNCLPMKSIKRNKNLGGGGFWIHGKKGKLGQSKLYPGNWFLENQCSQNEILQIVLPPKRLSFVRNLQCQAVQPLQVVLKLSLPAVVVQSRWMKRA